MPDATPHEVFIINLDFKTDRRERILKELPTSIKHAKIWRAVHGDTVKHPPWWTSGRGAWGCYRSHLQILEHCYNTGVESYLVLEDDAIFREGFDEMLKSFVETLPDDWHQAYIGGQLLEEIKHPPKKINDNCYIPWNVNRTHGFMVHKRGYEKLYHWLVTTPFAQRDHIDHHLGRLHEKAGINVYVPSRWLIGQAEGMSNISGKKTKENYWPDPYRCAIQPEALMSPRLVYLEAPHEVAEELHSRGWHQGYWRTGDGLDKGVCNAVASRDLSSGLRDWYSTVVREVVRDDLVVPCLYHPSLSLRRVQACNLGEVIHIQAETIEEALEKYQCECTSVTAET